MQICIFILQLPSRIPYNWKTPLTFSLTMTYLYVQFNGNYTIHFNCCMGFYSIAQYLTALTIDVRQCLFRLDAEIHKFDEAKTTRSYLNLKRMFHETIDFHTDVKQ